MGSGSNTDTQPRNHGSSRHLRLVGAEDRRRLIDRIRIGDPEAVEVLYREFGDLIDRLVWRLLGADPEHNDVVHQVYCELLSSIGNVAHIEALAGFVRSVAVNVVRKELRRRVFLRRFRAPDADPDRLPGYETDPALREVIRRLFHVLDRLRGADRIAFILRHVEKYTVVEVAEALGCSERHARRRLRRAEQRFEMLASRDSALSSLVAPQHQGSDP